MGIRGGSGSRVCNTYIVGVRKLREGVLGSCGGHLGKGGDSDGAVQCSGGGLGQHVGGAFVRYACMR